MELAGKGIAMTTETLEQFLTANPVVTYLAVLAIVLPWALAAIYQSTWSSTIKGALTVGACFIASALWMAVHTWSTEPFVIYGAALVGLTGLMYTIYKPSLRSFSQMTDIRR